MSQTLILKNKGLHTNSNQLSEVPEGALSIAKNVVIDKDSVVESRRGYIRLANPPASGSVINDRITSYQDHIITHRSNDNSMSYYVSGSGWTDYSGTYVHPDSNLARMQFAQMNGNLYFTTSVGVKMLDAYNGSVYGTGMPKGLDGTGSTTGASGWMTNNTQVAYRIVWGSRDANNNLYLGTASQRIIVANTSGGTRDVSLTFTIPDGITVSDFYQVYRSRESASSTDEPSDELQLVYEKNPTAGEITAKSVTFTESTPTSLMGASLYSNASQEGITESNDQPPYAADITTFKNFMFFGNVKTKHWIDIKLLATGGSALVANDTITINSMVFTAKAAENAALAEFKVFTAGSASQNIDDTARSLVKIINAYSSNTTIYAYYVSGFQDLPGQIMLEKRALDNTSFSVSTSRSAAFDLGSGTSSNDQYENGLMWSKIQQPEHVPSSHLEYIGSKNSPIRRIIGLRDSLFILKDDGVFRLTGSAGSWSIDPLDTSTKILAPDSAAVVNNQIFCLTDQGIVGISDVGVQVISRPIENLISDLMSKNFDNLKYLSYGVSYDTDRKYLLHTITESSDTYCTQAFVYNTFTQAWTTWEKSSKHSFVNKSDDRIYLCDASSKHILKERKSLTYADYVDEEKDGYTVSSSSSTTVVLNTVSGLNVGDLLYYSASVYSPITAIDTASSSVTVNDVRSWTPGAITVYGRIDCIVEYTAQHFQNPGVMKHFQEVSMLYRDLNFVSGVIYYFTDLSGGYQGSTFYGNFGGASWGSFPWGSVPWGGASRPKPVRSFVTREKSRGSLLSIKIEIAHGYALWSLNGLSVQYDWVSERTSRA